MHEKFLSINSIFPKFSSITYSCIDTEIQKILINCYNVVDHIVSQKIPVTWDTLCYPLMIVENELQRVWSPIIHLNSVQRDNVELRKLYEDNFLKILEYKNWINQHDGLYKLYQSLYKSDSYYKSSIVQKKMIKSVLSNFELSGILLSSKKKKYYKHIMFRLSQLSMHYTDNVFDATLHWNKLITNKEILSGIPERMLKIARVQAMKYKKKEGWLFTLQYPSYSAVMLYCDTAELREEFYWAFNTRASDQGPDAGKWDNTIIMDEILSLRYESARILGFNSYLEKSLETKMISSVEQIFNFLVSLCTHIRSNVQQELLGVQKFARVYGACNCLKPWDIAYYREKQKQYLFSIQDEELRFYFPEKVVLDGMFTVVNRMYNITVKQRYDIDIWDPYVRFFDIYDAMNQWKGGFYLDIYSRQDKCEGAWMHEHVSLMYRKNAVSQKPIVYLICNFERPKSAQDICFLTHNDVIVLFHEFGHVLHRILSTIDIFSISSICDTSQDVIELPSQIMEKFCWEFDVLRLISKHHITGESLSKDLLDNLLCAKKYYASSYMLDQIIYGLFDLRIHYEFVPCKSGQILHIFNEVVKEISIYPTISWNRFPHSFIHIFTDDYAAGYYSYLWSEMLVLNIWERFKISGILNTTIGSLFLDKILASGVSINVIECLLDFCQGKITMEPMLRYYKIPNIYGKDFISMIHDFNG